MTKLAILWIVFLFPAVNVLAGEGEYAVSRISPALLKNANAVVRFEQIRFEISNTKNATLMNHYVVTILNENGDEWANFEEYYNKFREVESVEAVLYDAISMTTGLSTIIFITRSILIQLNILLR
jgi:hypothetical protein